MGPRQCEVCKEAQSKYKCPSCVVPYCSLACYKKHKEVPCEKSLPQVEELPTLVLPQKSFQVEKPSYVISTKQLQCLAKSNEIRSSLEDGELRKLIQKIDSSEDPENELDKALKGQMFHQFTDKILSIVSPQEQAP